MTWQDSAACRWTDPDLWFPQPGQADVVRAAIRICQTCRVRTECLQESFRLPAHMRRVGIWGGLTAEQRRVMEVAR